MEENSKVFFLNNNLQPASYFLAIRDIFGQVVSVNAEKV